MYVCVHESLCDCRFSLSAYLCLIRMFPIRAQTTVFVHNNNVQWEKGRERVGVMALSFCVTLFIVFAFSTIEIDKYKMLSKANNTHEVINNETVISLNKPCMGIVTICVCVCDLACRLLETRAGN